MFNTFLIQQTPSSGAYLQPVRKQPWAVFLPQSEREVQVYQKTLACAVSCTGVGVHSGKEVRLTIKPAGADVGWVFVRTDQDPDIRKIPATWDHVSDTHLCTKLTNAQGVSIGTVEHLIAALAGCGIYNAILEINGPEVPILDGSSAPFVDLIQHAGIKTLFQRQKHIRVLKPVRVSYRDSWARLDPAKETYFEMQFNFGERVKMDEDVQETILQQVSTVRFCPDTDSFEEVLGQARTFGFYEDAAYLRSQGLAQGASLDNTIVIQDGKILNEEVLRYSNECTRHKLLDAFGDLALAGGCIQGRFKGKNSGHTLNNRLLRVLFADPEAWEIV